MFTYGGLSGSGRPNRKNLLDTTKISRNPRMQYTKIGIQFVLFTQKRYKDKEITRCLCRYTENLKIIPSVEEPNMFTKVSMKTEFKIYIFCSILVIEDERFFKIILIAVIKRQLYTSTSQYLLRKMVKDFDHFMNVGSLCIHPYSINIQNEALDGASWIWRQIKAFNDIFNPFKVSVHTFFRLIELILDLFNSPQAKTFWDTESIMICTGQQNMEKVIKQQSYGHPTVFM